MSYEGSGGGGGSGGDGGISTIGSTMTTASEDLLESHRSASLWRRIVGGEISGRYGGDMEEIWGRNGGDVGWITLHVVGAV